MDDFGNVFVTSKSFLVGLFAGTAKSSRVELTRMPMPASIDRFRSSPLLVKGGVKVFEGDPAWSSPQCSHNVVSGDVSFDGLSRSSLKRSDDVNKFSEEVVVGW